MEDLLRRFEMPGPDPELKRRIDRAVAARPGLWRPALTAAACAVLAAAAAIGVYLAFTLPPPVPADLTPSDVSNVGPRPDRVRTEPLKVLYIERLPRWEYRYLKNALIRDVEILCHCLLTSADRDFPQEHSHAAGRPPEQVRENPRFFEPLKDLPRVLDYDVVILGDLQGAIDGNVEFFTALRSFVVHEGRGLVVLAPTLRPSKTLEDLLPLAPADHPWPIGDPPVYEPVKWAAHPISAGMPEFKPDLILPNLGVGPGVTILAASGKHQVFVCAPRGPGRVFQSMSETWKLRRGDGDQPHYYPFWRRVFDWVSRSRSPSSSLVLRLTAAKETWKPGEKIELRLTLKNDSSAPVRYLRPARFNWDTPGMRTTYSDGYAEVKISQLEGDKFRERLVGPAVGLGPIPPERETLNPGRSVDVELKVEEGLPRGIYEVHVQYYASKGLVPGAREDSYSNTLRLTIR
jgi:hypothetical protein